MLFNSNEFLVFFGFFLVCYWLVRHSLALRNCLVVVASYVFYCWWDYRFGALLLFTSLTDFFLGRLIAASPSVQRRKFLLFLSVTCNLTLLGFFKYFDFFAQSLEALLASCGFRMSRFVLDVTLPVGISFYTFQSMSYIIDVYRRQIPATRNVIDFLAFVSFFPQLVAGPIERASHLLPQFAQTLRITRENIERGLWLMIWGMFQKVVLADNLAPLAELAFDHAQPSLPVLALGSIAFGLRILCDFGGYSDIARGVASVLGFTLMINFNAPYTARSLKEFWGRWHISLSTWIRDYLYIPLGGNRRGEWRTGLNLLVVMLLAGLWHGAAINFVLWGLWHGAGLLGYHVWSRLRPADRPLPKAFAWALTMAFVFGGWVLFRIQSAEGLFNATLSLGRLDLPVWWKTYVLSLTVLAAPVVIMQFRQGLLNQADSFAVISRRWRVALNGLMLLAIAAWWSQEPATFIYFQF
ncbi:MAG TPA: MBOAT family O-acyltransferase [Verrucomicrobiae bacterium]|nr:MBOAT family O-acyltransferase [Verrucomicrobiae bacterium]